MSDPAPTLATRTLPNPLTGEVLVVDVSTPAGLAELRDWLGDLKRQIDATLADVDADLCAHLDRENARSAGYGQWHVETQPALETVWDVPALGLALEGLVAAGALTRAAAEAALERQPPPAPKPRARELGKLLGHSNPAVVDAIDACRRAQPRARRRVTVSRTANQPRLQGP
jgi:hypothetical protein